MASPETYLADKEAKKSGGQPPGYLQAVAEGRDPGNPDAEDPMLTELAAMKEAITAINARLDAIGQQAGGGEQS